MSEQYRELHDAYHKLMSIKGECKDKVCELHGVTEMTVKQINYLKLIDSTDNMTSSLLAEISKITKPSVSDLISKLEGFGCVYREPCTEDKRVSYIRLTEKGINIARHEQTAVKNLINRMVKTLSKNEVAELINLFNKVK